MGNNTAMDLAENIDLSLEDAIGYHLQGNHYPPVPLSMVPVCIQTLDFANDNLWDETVEMPEGISYNSGTSAPVSCIYVPAPPCCPPCCTTSEPV